VFVTDASAPDADDQVRSLVMVWTVPFENRPVAVNCWLWPCTMEATEGETVMESSMGNPSAPEAFADAAPSMTSVPPTSATGRRRATT
jgi:hypothetical protein